MTVREKLKGLSSDKKKRLAKVCEQGLKVYQELDKAGETEAAEIRKALAEKPASICLTVP